MRLIYLALFLLSSICYGEVINYDLEQVSSKLGLSKSFKKSRFTFLGVDKIYWGKNIGSAMLVVEKIPGTKSEISFVYEKSLTIIEFPSTQSEYTSLAIWNISPARIREAFNSKFVVERVMDKFPSFNTLYAQDECMADNTEFVSSDLESQTSTSYWELASSCMMGVLQGIWESTGGMLSSAWEGLKSLVRDPKKFWREKVEGFKKLKGFFRDFEIKVQEIAAGIKNLPDETKAEIFCSFIGSIGTDVLISVLTAGAGSAVLILTLTKFLKKIVKLERFFSFLSKVGKLSQLPKKFFKKISSGEIGEKVLDGIDSFTSSGLDDMALGYAKCAM